MRRVVNDHRHFASVTPITISESQSPRLTVRFLIVLPPADCSQWSEGFRTIVILGNRDSELGGSGGGLTVRNYFTQIWQ